MKVDIKILKSGKVKSVSRTMANALAKAGLAVHVHPEPAEVVQTAVVTPEPALEPVVAAVDPVATSAAESESEPAAPRRRRVYQRRDLKAED